MVKEKIWTIPNMITMARIVAIPVLLVAIYMGEERFFAWLFFISLVSDIIDGLVARIFKMASKLGALLDSSADAMLSIVAIIGLLAFRMPFLKEHAIILSIAITADILIIPCCLFRYGRLPSFHSYLSRITAYSQGFMLLCIFAGFYPLWLFYPMIAVSLIASLEVYILMGLLPQWTPNARGLYWVLKSRKNFGAP